MRTVTTPNLSQPPIEIHFGCDTLSSCPAFVRRTFRRGSLNRKVRGKPAGSSSAKQLVAYRFPGVAAASLNFQQGATAEGVGRGLPTVMLLQQVATLCEIQDALAPVLRAFLQKPRKQSPSVSHFHLRTHLSLVHETFEPAEIPAVGVVTQ